LSNGTPLRDRRKPISNVALASGFESNNNEAHTIASRSNTHEVCEDIVDGHACWKIKGGLKSAEANTKWYKALLVNDCKSLMEQLDKNGSLVVQTGYNGRTVLLAAVRRGCTPLVNQVMDLFKDDAGHFITRNDHTKISKSPLHDLFQAEDFGTKLRAVEIMQQFMGSDIILCHMNAFYQGIFPWSLLHSVDALTGNDVERRMIAHEGNQLKGGAQSGVPMIHAKTHLRNNLASKNNTHLEHVNNYDINPLHGKTKSIPIKKTSIVSLTPTSGNDEHIDVAKVDILAKIRNIIDKLLKTKKFEALREEYSKHKDYNFDEKCTEFIFHYACQSMPSILMPRRASNKQAEDFLWSFFKELGGEEDQEILQGSDEDKILQSLYEIKNWQGKTPCHAALNGSAFGFEKLLGLLRYKNDPMTIKLFLNACDARGWTPLHKAVAMVSEHDSWGHRRFINLLLKNEELNMNGKLPISQATPLHLAILHNLPRVVGLLIRSPKNREEVLNASLERNIRFSNTTEPSRRSSNSWSPLQLAAIMGHRGVVEELITKVCMMNSLILLLGTTLMGS
jgi:ankyrin repeat protein